MSGPTEDAPRRLGSVRFQNRLERLRSRLWFIPGTFAVAAVLGAILLVPLDRAVDRYVTGDLSGVLFAGGPDSARVVLSTIAAAMLTFTALVFSVTMLVLQQASSQLSPRVMRTFLRDRVNQSVLGLFVATFLYSLLLLRDVRTPPDGDAFVPAIAVTVAYGLLVASVGAFVYYIHHMAEAIRAGTVLRNVGAETRAAIGRLYPEGVGDEPERPGPPLPDREPDRVVTLDRTGGVVTAVDDDRLLALARDHRLTIELLHMVGDFVPQGAPLLRAWSRPVDDPERPEGPREPAGGPPAGIERRSGGGPGEGPGEGAGAPSGPSDPQLTATVELGAERTMTQDAAFGFRQIVDIAERALSPGTNDPTTAVQALDQLHDLLRRLATRRIPSPVRVDEGGTVLLVLPRPDWDDYVALAIDEIRQYGRGSIQIARRLRYLLLDLEGVAPPFRQGPIRRQLRLLDAAIEQGFTFAEDRRAAGLPSPSGQGAAEEPPEPAPPEKSTGS